jgi:hypothetical protein
MDRSGVASISAFRYLLTLFEEVCVFSANGKSASGRDRNVENLPFGFWVIQQFCNGAGGPCTSSAATRLRRDAAGFCAYGSRFRASSLRSRQYSGSLMYGKATAITLSAGVADFVPRRSKSTTFVTNSAANPGKQANTWPGHRGPGLEPLFPCGAKKRTRRHGLAYKARAAEPAGYDRLSEHMKQLQKQLTSRERNAMPTADDCRRNAAECLQALKLATKDEVRSALITWHSAGTNLPTTRNESKRGCRVSRGTSCRESAAPRTKAQS